MDHNTIRNSHDKILVNSQNLNTYINLAMKPLKKEERKIYLKISEERGAFSERT